MLATMTNSPDTPAEAARQLHEIMHALGSLPNRAHLSAEDVCLRVCAASEWPVSALAEEFTPYLSASSDEGFVATPAEELRMTVDAGLADRVRRWASTPPRDDHPEGDPEQAHTLLGGVHLVRKVAGQPSARSDAHLLWNEDEPAVSYILLPDNSPTSQRLLVRMVRAIVGRILLSSGWVPLHAACVVTDAGAVCLSGDRGRGKTTAMLHLLGGNDRTVRFLANDKIFVAERSGDLVARALPTAVGIRPPTVRMFPQLEAFAGQAAALHFENTPGVVPSTPSDPATCRHERDPRLLVTPRRLADAFATTLVPSAALAALVGVDRGSGVGNVQQPSRWEGLSQGAALALWRSAYLNEWLLYDEHELARLTPSPATLRRDHRQLTHRLADAVPTAAFESGSDPGAELHRGLDRLLS
jgi:hypothetical protein